MSASLRSGLGLALPVQWEYMWDLWWEKRHWQHGISAAQFPPCVLVSSLSIQSYDGVVGAFTRFWAGRYGVWIQTAAEGYFLENFRFFCWSHPPSCTMGGGSCLPSGKVTIFTTYLLLVRRLRMSGSIAQLARVHGKIWPPTVTYSFFCYLGLQFHKDVIWLQHKRILQNPPEYCRHRTLVGMFTVHSDVIKSSADPRTGSEYVAESNMVAECY